MTAIAKISQEFKQALLVAKHSKDIEALRVDYLGKNGHVTSLLKTLGALAPEERRTTGQEINTLKDEITNLLEANKSALESIELLAKLANEKIDVTLAPRGQSRGRIHPLTQVMIDVKDIFTKLGFTFVEAQDIDDDWHNFTALNIPENHPARQMHDTFYVKDAPNLVLRTHTSNSQIRTLNNSKPPIRAFTFGKTYRSDMDATHTPMFHQLEVFAVDEGINMGHLKWILEEFLKAFFLLDTAPEIRLRPSFFPFTEPSAEVDVRCDRSDKSTLKIGQGNDWLEILGSGLIHPKVLKNVGIDSEKYSGFAFGAGLERLAMLKYNIPDLRTFFEGDYRWHKHYGL